MKVDKLKNDFQTEKMIDWFVTITEECKREYPIEFALLTPHDQVVDMGCNVGGFSEAFKHKFQNILAIDASLYNVQWHKDIHPHQQVLHRAVSNIDGKTLRLKKYMGDNNSETNSGNYSTYNFIYKHNNHGMSGTEWEEVKSISLETILEMVGGEIGLLKIDIEGAEYETLYQKDLTKINYITGEFHNYLGKEKLSNLFNWISQTHREIYTKGGLPGHYVKMWGRK